MRGQVAAAVAAAVVAAGPSGSKPNVVFIMSDDLGIGEVSAYRAAHAYPPQPDGRIISTPNIDRMFSLGMRMDNAYTGEAVCSPSRASLLLGKHTGHSYSRGNHVYEGHDLPIPADQVTWASLLKAQGYKTAYVGKYGLGWWNNSGAPWVHGFDYYYGQLDQAGCHNMYPPGPTPDFDGGLAVWVHDASNGINHTALSFPGNQNASREYCMSPAGVEACAWTHELWTNKSLELLQAQAAAGAGEAPLAIFIGYTDPHAGGWKGEDESGAPVPSDGPFASTDWPEVEKDHAAQITLYQDTDIGRIVSTIYAPGSAMAGNTLLMFSSDNGAHNEGAHDVEFFDSNGPYKGWKRSLHEGGIHTPFAAVWPGVIAAGSVSAAPMAFWDILPTLADAAGVEPSKLPSGVDGLSLLPVWTGQAGTTPTPTPLADHPLYWEFCTCITPAGLPCGSGVSGATSFQTAVRARDATLGWKGLSLSYGAQWKLYNLTADPYESTDLAAQYPDVVQQLQQIAKAQHVDSPVFPVNPCVPS